jgi:2-dehydro-3-deoxygluconokinase
LNSDAISPKAVGLGESLLRLSAPGHERLGQARQLDVHIGGAEMNALIGLRALGLQAHWLTRLADNPLGRRIAAHAAERGVVAVVDWDAEARAPLYFVEHGAAPRSSQVLYDRGATAMTTLTPETFDWAEQLQDASIALCSGITCALGAAPARAVTAFLARARTAGARTVFDVNYRSRLWSWPEAVSVLRPVLERVDILFASRHDLARLVAGAAADQDAANLARAAIKQFGHSTVVLRESTHPTPGLVSVRATAVTADEVYTSAIHQGQMVDAFGAGDAALAAFVAAILRGEDLAAAAEEAAWACIFQHTVVGDAPQVTAADLVIRGQTGRILR